MQRWAKQRCGLRGVCCPYAGVHSFHWWWRWKYRNEVAHSTDRTCAVDCYYAKAVQVRTKATKHKQQHRHSCTECPYGEGDRPQPVPVWTELFARGDRRADILAFKRMSVCQHFQTGIGLSLCSFKSGLCWKSVFCMRWPFSKEA